MKSLLKKTGGMVLCILILGLTALAQTTGSISGTINDPNGAPIVGATVIVKGETGAEFTAVTSDNGTYIVPALNSGNYTVTVSAAGFKKTVVSKVKVDVSKPSTVSVALEVGSPEAEVNVAASGAELINTQTATVGTTITGRQITELPFSSRDALDLVTLLPGTATVGRPRQSSINGLPKGALNISIDGVDAQDNLLKSNDGFFTFIRPRIDAIDEVTVSTANPGAESSGDGAVQIKFVTKGGTNEYNGGLFWYHRNPALNANYWFNNRDLPPDPRTGKAPHTRILLNQFGGKIGGPIRIPRLYDGRDKAFFFISNEEYRLPEQATRTRRILGPNAQQGIFQYGTTTVNLLNIAAANGLPGTIDPTIGNLLTAIRTATSQGGLSPVTGQPNTQDFTFTSIGGQKRRFTTARFDFNLTKNHHLENIWNYQKFRNASDFLNNAEASFPGFPNFGGQDSNRWSNSTGLRSTITSNLVNEARFGMTGGVSLFRGDVTRSQFANQGGNNLNFNFSNLAASAFGLSNITAGAPSATTGFSTAGGTTNRRNSPTFEFSDNATWVIGTHTVGFGGQYKRVKLYTRSDNQIAPLIDFGVDTTDTAVINAFSAANLPGSTAAQRTQAQQLYALITGRIVAATYTAYLSEGDNQQYTLLADSTQRSQQNTYGLYAQDSWRVRPNLTLNYGLRWQPQEAFTATNNTFSRASSFADVFGISGLNNVNRPGTLTGADPTFVAVQPGEKVYKDDLNNFAPSFGVAWSPNFKNNTLKRIVGESSVFRAGYSVAFVREGTNVALTVLTTNPGSAVDASRAVVLGNLPVGTLLRNPATYTPAAVPSGLIYPIAGTAADTTIAFDPNIQTGYVQSWSAGYQREIGKNMAFEARYVGNRGIKLWRTYNLISNNDINVFENGFANEYRLAQANLAANNAFCAANPATCGARLNSYAYFGPGTGTSPLPIILGYYRGAGAPGTFNPSNPALYTSALFTNPTLVNQLSPNNANVLGFAANVDNSAARRANALSVGLPVNFFRVNPATRGGSFVVDNGGHSWYDALVLEFRRRLSQGLLVQASYTFSKSESDMFVSSSIVNSNYTTIRNPALSKTNSPFDVVSTFKADWIYELPFGKGQKFFGTSNKWVNGFVGGWQFSGTARLQSGAPINFGNVQLVGMTRDEFEREIKVRKNASNVTYLPTDIINNTIAAFNPDPTNATGYSAQFGTPTGRFIAPAGFGNCAQRYAGECGFSNLVVHGPKFFRTDMTIAKRIFFTERTNLELRAEFLNAFNNTQWRVGGWAADNVTVTGLGATTFGLLANGTAYQDTSTTNDPGGRLVQLVIRINF